MDGMTIPTINSASAANPSASTSSRRSLMVLLAVLWFGAMGAGTVAMFRYEFTAGGDAGAPKAWPSASSIPREAGQPTLVVFAHPRCTCTDATMQELEEVMAHTQSNVKVFVALFTPHDADEEWTNTAIWRRAAAIPGVIILKDEDGREAQRFNASTSGRTMLYGSKGELLFDGGITGSRGHVGENAGSDALISLLSQCAAANTTTPVFGCQIASPK